MVQEEGFTLFVIIQITNEQIQFQLQVQDFQQTNCN